jgi:hypothetical protein
MNSRTVVAALVLSLVTSLAHNPAHADVPDIVTYSSRLTDGTGWGQSTILALTFRLYDAAEEGQALWEHSFDEVAVEDGAFSVMLVNGDNPVTPEVETDFNVTGIFAAHPQTWLTVCIGQDCTTEDDLAPRQQVGSVPYALRTETAENLVEPNSYVQNQTALPQAASFYIDGSGYFGGNVGIGTTEPGARLDIGNGFIKMSRKIRKSICQNAVVCQEGCGPTGGSVIGGGCSFYGNPASNIGNTLSDNGTAWVCSISSTATTIEVTVICANML